MTSNNSCAKLGSLIGSIMTGIVTMCVIGCARPHSETPGIGRTNYLLGTLCATNINAIVDAEVIMPNAWQFCICIVVDGVAITNEVQTHETLEALRTAQLETKLYDEKANLLWKGVSENGSLGELANWYTPNLAFVINPGLQCYERKNPITETLDTKTNNLIAGNKYKILARFISAASITNQIQVRAEYWGVKFRTGKALGSPIKE